MEIKVKIAGGDEVSSGDNIYWIIRLNGHIADEKFTLLMELDVITVWLIHLVGNGDN